MTNQNIPEPTIASGHGLRLLTRRLLRQTVPVSDMTIWRWERDGRFPRHVTIHGRNYWVMSEVAHWLSTHLRGTASSDGREGG
jgi:predicted DNA-binding transcriptional regulator AlpA